jgi:glycosyltransferase involved in cell wall biosynthesis
VNGSIGRPKVAVLTNILAPYRLPVFQRLAERFEVTVLYSGEESNRDQWHGLAGQVHGFAVKRARGFTVAWSNRERGVTQDTRYLHINPGLILDLIRLRPAAVITNQMGFRSLVALAYGWLFRRPVWVWWGGTRHTERRLSRGKRLFRHWLVARVGRWFSYGATSTDYLLSLGVPRQNVVELQNCVPEMPYAAGQTPIVELATRPVLLCVGQLVSRKGVDLLLDAAARVQAAGFRFSLLLVGSGPDRAALEEKANALGLRHVHFHAPQPPEHMPGVYRSADVLIFPTREDVWGLVVNEALWSGVPALVSVYAGCASELVPLSSTFDPLNPADFTAKLRDAVTGALPPPEVTRLRPIDEVARTVIREVEAAL